MELRLLELLIRIFDPRKWRLRLAQTAGGTAALLWIWYRSVDRVEVDRALRDAHWNKRRLKLRASNHSLEHDRLHP